MKDGALFCGLCRDWQSEKKSSVAAHTKRSRHAVSKEKAKKDRLREQSLMQALSKQKESRIVEETLPSQQRAYRVRVVEAFLRKGLPLAKVNGLRDLPEKNAFQLTAGAHLSQ